MRIFGCFYVFIENYIDRFFEYFFYVSEQNSFEINGRFTNDSSKKSMDYWTWKKFPLKLFVMFDKITKLLRAIWPDSSAGRAQHWKCWCPQFDPALGHHLDSLACSEEHAFSLFFELWFKSFIRNIFGWQLVRWILLNLDFLIWYRQLSTKLIGLYLISVFHKICKKVKIMNDYILHLCESFRGMFFVTCLFFLFGLARRNDVVSNRVNSFTNRVKCSKNTITMRWFRLKC